MTVLFLSYHDTQSTSSVQLKLYKNGSLVNMVPRPFRLYNKMAMEVILSAAFGRAVDVQGGKGGKLYESAVAVNSAFTPPKDNDPVNVFAILQFLLGGLCSTVLCLLNVL